MKVLRFSRKGGTVLKEIPISACCSPILRVMYLTCRQESVTLKNKWYVSKNLKWISESRVLKICYRRFFQHFYVLHFGLSLFSRILPFVCSKELLTDVIQCVKKTLVLIFSISILSFFIFFIYLSVLWKGFQHGSACFTD